MEARLRRRRPAIDITWVSCRGVRSSLPFHTPCLYASIFVVWSSSATSRNAHGQRRHHRVKTPTDRAGGENPEWDAPLLLYLPGSPPPVMADGENRKDGRRRGDDSGSGRSDDDVLLLKFEVKAEVAVLGDVHAASAAVPIPDLVADGRTRRVSYQLVGPDGRQPNGVVSFSYAVHDHERNDEDGQSSSSSDGENEPATPPFCTTPSAASTAVAVPPPTITAATAPRLYPEIEWTLEEQPLLYPQVTAKNFTIADARYYPPAPPPPPAPPAEPSSIYPPEPPTELASSVYAPVAVTEKSFCSMYPTVAEPGSALYPTLDLVAPVSYYYPPPPAYGVARGDQCLYG